ncbi:MAG: chromosome segregation protein SMC [Oscillospiraceae bacterium]|nr:chromosome segregation protein SMC [Oscillospiraceae bacterium]
MYLKSLEVQGFKSFPDKTLIRFGDDITAIVGPNGSGKSNISDAILWVMGEQSSKTLRGAKMEDVIFGGTQKRAAVGFAEATLILDNSDRALPYDSDEVMITRRYYRSGDSEYYINRQSARLRDINEMFMDTGLGKEGYSNIGQGRIDEILSLKSADRREIFEEAAGISKYRHRKEETERKLAHTEDNLMRIGDKVSELELQLEPLRVQSEKATKYLELRDELQGIEVAVWLDKLDKLSAEAKKAEEDYTSASFVLQQAHDDLEKMYLSAEQMGAQLRHQNGAVDTLRDQVSLLEGTHQQIEGQIAVLESTVKHNEETIARSKEDLQGQEDRSSGLTVQMEQATARVAEIDTIVAQKAAELEVLQKQLMAMTADAQGLTRQFMELRTREVNLTADLAAREADEKALEANMAGSTARAEELRADLQSGEAKEQDAREQMAACQKELKKAQEEVTANQNAIAGYTLRQTTRVKRRDELAEQVQKLRNQLDEVSAKARAFRAMEQDFEGYQKSVRQVMQAAKGGSLGHIHGPISQLIRAEDQYTVAVEIALGGAMQQIVVDSEQDAKAAIAYLKRTNGGRTTFWPLSSIRGRVLKETGLEKCRGYVGIASKLIKFEKRYENLMEDLLGRIVIVEDIDAAIAMAKQYGNRFKIVTLDGQVVNPGGSMTGGSVNREAGILSRANELDKLTAREKELSAKLETLETEFQEARRAADQVEFQMNTAREQLQEAEKQVLTQEGYVRQRETWLQAICDAKDAAARELENLEKRDAADREQLAAIRAQVGVFTEQLHQTRQQISALEGTQSEADKATSVITDQMNALRTDSAALEAERTTANAHIADLRVLQAAAEGDKSRKLSDIDAIAAENVRLQEEIQRQFKRQEENAAEIARVRQGMKDAQGEYARIEAEKSKTEGDIQEKNKSILNMERACALLENKKETALIEERNTVDKLWDTYGLTPGTAVEKKAEIESVAAASRRIAELKRKISSLGTPNLGAIEEFARVNERYTYLTAQRDDVLSAKKDLEGIIKEITQQMTEIFVTEFAKINEYFGKVFEEMFQGGKGQLLLEDPENPLTCGIEIRVQPPGKQVKTITLLSGGEKAFVAIALYFAILKVRPTPFCMLDEIDAALDDRNVERFSSYLRNLSTKTQFIVITHRRGTMEASDVLYGVTMQEQGISKLLRLDLNQMEEYLGIVE